MSNQHPKSNPSNLKDKVNHMVVLMQENRSFDNLLGCLYGSGAPNGQSFYGLDWSLWNPLANIDADGIPFTEKVGVGQNGAEFKTRGLATSDSELSRPIHHRRRIPLQDCSNLEEQGHLTKRDEAAPDLSGLLSLKKPRTKKLPNPKPLKYSGEVEEILVNDLHQVAAEILAEQLGVETPTDKQRRKFIHKHYAKRFKH